MPELKKVLICITKGGLGGAQKYVVDLASNLPLDKFLVKVITGEPGPMTNELLKNKIDTFNLKSLDRNISYLKDWQTFLSLLKIFKKERPDILHLNSSKMGVLGSVAGRLTGIKKIIFTVHGWAFNEQRTGLEKIIFKLGYYLIIKLAHQVIVVSETTKKQIKIGYKNQKKIIVIHNGIEIKKFLDKNLAQTNLDSKIVWKDYFNLGIIAELHPSKGINFLISALEKIRTDRADCFNKILVSVIGDGDEKKTLSTQIEQAKLSNKIILLGAKNTASQYLKAFDIFILPSITEALPYVLLEAGLASLPIITTKVGGNSEIIDDMTNGILVPSKQPEEIAKAICFLFDNPEKRLIFGRKIEEKIRQDFNLNQMIKKTVALYN